MEEEEAALSDFEEDELEAAPVVLPTASGSASGAADSAELKKERRAEDIELRKKLASALESLDQVTKQRDESVKQLDTISKQKEDAIKGREQSRSEIETAAKLLIAGAEKLTSLIGDSKGFSGGFPRSSKYTGIAAICHGFCKRTEEIVEAAIKSRNETRDRMDHRNYEIAIEVSQLENSIVRVKEELERKTAEFQKLSAERLAFQQDLQEKLSRTASQEQALKKKCESAEEKSRALEVEAEKLKKNLVEQMKGYLATEEFLASFLHKIDGKAVISVAELPFSDFSDVEKVHNEYLRRVNSVSNMLVHTKNSWEEKEELRHKERTSLDKELQRFSQREKEMVDFIRNSLKETQNDQDDDMQKLVSVLDAEMRRLRLKVLDLEKQLIDARVETEKVKKLSALQAKDLAAKAVRIKELEIRDGVVSENVEGLTAEIAAAEEELLRWKKAATEEAAAGVAILEEVDKCNQEIAGLNQLVVHLRQSLEESNSKLQSKEEMAAAAIAARNAAVRSLKIADERAAELRERLEDMSRQMEDVEAQLERSRVCGGKLLEVFPWVRGKICSYRSSLRQATVASAEMEELTEPLV